MAKQIGVIKLSGMIDDLVFYNHPEDGPLVRTKSYLSGKQLIASSFYQQALDNAAEFTTSIQSAHLLRTAFRELLFPIADGKLSSRMNKVMLEILQQDPDNGLGERVIHGDNLAQLEGFEFNRHLPLKSSFLAPYDVLISPDDAHIHIDMPAFIPVNSFVVKDYVKAVRLVSGAARIDLQQQRYTNSCWQTEMISLDSEPVDTIRFSYPFRPEPGQAFFLTLGLQQWVHMDELPKSDISKRKYWLVRQQRDENKMMAFTGSLAVIKVVIGKSPSKYGLK